MIVKGRSLFDDRVNVGNGDQDLGGPFGHGFGNGKLVQITRIIVVDGAPEKVPEIARRFLSSRRRPVDFVELGKRLDRKIREKSSFKHRPTGNSLQDRAVFSVACIRHIISFLKYPVVISCSRNAFRIISDDSLAMSTALATDMPISAAFKVGAPLMPSST